MFFFYYYLLSYLIFQDRELDLYLLINLYLHHMSLHWDKEMPSELRSLYIQVYDILAKFVNYESWNQLEDEDLIVMYRITLFYMELSQDSTEEARSPENEWYVVDILLFYWNLIFLIYI